MKKRDFITKNSLRLATGKLLFIGLLISANLLRGQVLDRWNEQTPFRNQMHRGTCVVHASIAALEAAYVRQMGFDRNTFDLSEQYLHHIQKSTWLDLSPGINYENQSCYWWGGSPRDIVAVLENYRIPEEKYCPYEDDGQMQNLISQLNLPVNPQAFPDMRRLRWTENNPYIQEDLDKFEYDLRHIDIRAYRNAKFGAKKVVFLTQAEVQDTGKIEDLIDQEHEVVIQMKNQIGTLLAGDLKILGIWNEDHAILLIGYDKPNQVFFFKNSNITAPRIPVQPAGLPLGEIALSYEQISTFAYDGLYIESVLEPQEDIRSTFLGSWNMTHDGWRGKLVIRRIGHYDQTTNADPHNFSRFTRLGTYYNENGRTSNVSGEINGNCMDFYILFPGAKNEQKFTAYIYGQGESGGRKMAGSTSFQDVSFGVFASRNDLPAQKTTSGSVQPKEFTGLWIMEHDGWEGLLTINRINNSNIEGIYTFTKENKKYPVKGRLYKQRLDFEILFSGNPQKFVGYILSRDRDIMAGVTLRDNKYFGFHALKKGPGLPDLIIKNIEISQTPEELYEPVSLWPRVIIENRWETIKEKDLPFSCTWELFRDGYIKIEEGKFNISQLQAGKEIFQEFRLKQLRKGIYKFRVQVDDANKINEMVEDNNTLEITFKVKGPLETPEPLKQIPPSIFREPRSPIIHIGLKGGMSYGGTDFPVFKGGEFGSDVYSEIPVMSGYSFSKLDAVDENYECQNTLSFMGGLSFELFPLRNLSLEAGAHYAEKTVQTENPSLSDYFDKTIFQTVSLPLVLKLNLGRGHTKFFIGGGIEGTYILRIRNHYHQRIGDQTIDRTFDQIGTTRLKDMLESPFFFNAIGTIGLRIGKITLEVRYVFGLEDIIFESTPRLNIGRFEEIQTLFGFWF